MSIILFNNMTNKVIRSKEDFRRIVSLEVGGVNLFSHPLKRFQYYLRKIEYLETLPRSIVVRIQLLIARYYYRNLQIKCGFTIPIGCIDEGLKLPHYGGIVINGNVSIGKNCTIRPFVVIGNKRSGANSDVPVIGDNVEIGSNVVIIGKVRIGNNVVIGAGSVVINDVPDNTIVAGNPARILKTINV